MSCGTPSLQNNRPKALSIFTQFGEGSTKRRPTFRWPCPILFQTPYFCQREDAACSTSRSRCPGLRKGERQKLAAAARAEQSRAARVALREAAARPLSTNTAAIFDWMGGGGGGGGGRGPCVASTARCHISRGRRSTTEKFYFTPGDLGLQGFDTSAGKLGNLSAGPVVIRRRAPHGVA